MEKGGMSAREKGDIYWRKRKRYLAAAAVRNGLKEGYFNPDMAEDILERYKEIKATGKRELLNGNEFSEKPPTAVGRRAFAYAVANLMNERDHYELLINNFPGDENYNENQILVGGIEEILACMEQAVGDYFIAAGLTQDGERITDKAERKRAFEAFKNSGELYHELMVRNNKELGVRFIDELRKRYGLDDLMDAPDPGPGPVFGMLVNKYPEAVKNNSALIEKLKQVNISTRHEAAMIVAAREKLRQEVTKEYFDPATDEVRKFILEASFGEYSYKVDENLCTLLYKQEATAAYIGWVLLSAPVDPVLAEYVDPEWGQRPQVMDEGMLLSEQEEFVFLRKYDRWEEVGEIKGLSDVRKRAEEIKQYLYAHPWQFDAQCITTISRGTQQLPGIVADARAIRDGLDRLTANGYLNEISMEEGMELYEIWTVADLITRVGYTVMDFTVKHENCTIKETVEDIKDMLPLMSYSKQELSCRDAVKKLMRERAGNNV